MVKPHRFFCICACLCIYIYCINIAHDSVVYAYIVKKTGLYDIHIYYIYIYYIIIYNIMYIYKYYIYIYIIYIRFCSKVGFGWNIADINPALFSSTKVQPLIWERSPSRNAKKIQKNKGFM